MPTVIPTISIGANTGIMSGDIFASLKSPDFLAAGIVTAIGLSLTLALTAFFPLAGNAVALALMMA